ncbi:hypothetical protein ACFY3G_18270 [Streptomyces phaeochromogenes]|uniref:hypothetical protein n=1 Tax=Streptomyces phaeochromogenes TaxID=1923 RepID=UPI0036BC0FDA
MTLLLVLGRSFFMQRTENQGCRPINPEETISHLGGRGLTGALTYIGTRKIERSELRLRLYVNGKPGHIWRMTITVSGADLYDVELWSVRGGHAQLLGESGDLYFDQLQAAVEELYDTAISEHNGGVIQL